MRQHTNTLGRQAFELIQAGRASPLRYTVRASLIGSQPPQSVASLTSLRSPTPIISRTFRTTALSLRAPVPTTPPPPRHTAGSSHSLKAGSASHLTHGHGHGHTSSGAGTGAGAGSGSGHGSAGKRSNGYRVWYREIVPAMVPPLLLSFTLFLLLSLLRTHLSHERSLADSTARIEQLELELDRLARDARRTRDRERRERERILPIVVGKVLKRVGVLGGEMEGEEHEEVGAAVEKREEERLLV